MSAVDDDVSGKEVFENRITSIITACTTHQQDGIRFNRTKCGRWKSYFDEVFSVSWEILVRNPRSCFRIVRTASCSERKKQFHRLKPHAADPERKCSGTQDPRNEDSGSSLAAWLPGPKNTGLQPQSSSEMLEVGTGIVLRTPSPL